MVEQLQGLPATLKPGACNLFLPPLPREDVYYQTPDSTHWRDSHQRRRYRRQRMSRHERYLRALHWSHTMLCADIRPQLDCVTDPAHRSWLLEQELARRFEHCRSVRWLARGF